MHRTDIKPRAEVLAEMQHGSSASRTSRCSANSASRTPMRWRCRRARADALGIRSHRRSRRARAQSFPSPATTNSSRRPEWAASGGYGSDFREQRQMQPEFMYPPSAHGEVDVIAGYTSDGRIAQYDLTCSTTRHASRPTTRSCCCRPAAPMTRSCVLRFSLCWENRYRQHARGQPARQRQ